MGRPTGGRRSSSKRRRIALRIGRITSDGAADRIGRITVAGDVTTFPLPLTVAFSSAITAGGDGGMWFTLNRPTPAGGST
ncbi:hypothetical protein BX266_7158 [Streptomyces sp. TLI_171]|nr:hypothetical protein BX266_7158 [Streptomyces sp. TLI_171]